MSIVEKASAFLSGLTGVENKSASPTKEKGAPGFQNYGGFVVENEKNPKLVNTEKYRTYSDMLANVSIIGAGVRYFLNLVSKANWNVEPANDSEEAKAKAEFVKEVINDMRTPWYRVVRRGAMYRFYGFSIQEWTAKRRKDGSIGFLDVAARPQHTIDQWDTSEVGEVLGVVQRSPQSQERIYLPTEKIVYIVDDALTDNPEGMGLFRHIVETSDALRRYEQLEGFGFETDLRGIPIAKAPLTQLARMVKNGEITKKESNEITAPLRSFVQNHIKSARLGMMVDSSTYRAEDAAAAPSSTAMWGVELLKAGSNSQDAIALAINRLNHEIARLLGVEALLLGADGKGTQALSKDKSQNFFLIVDSTLQELAESYKRGLVDTLWELNGYDDDLKPTFKPEAIKFKDVTEITTAMKDLANAGAPLMPDDPIINEIRDLLGLKHADLSKIIEDMALLGNRARSQLSLDRELEEASTNRSSTRSTVEDNRDRSEDTTDTE